MGGGDEPMGSLDSGSVFYYSVTCQFATVVKLAKLDTSGQSYKQFTLVNYDPRGGPDFKMPHIMTLES